MWGHARAQHAAAHGRTLKLSWAQRLRKGHGVGLPRAERGAAHGRSVRPRKGHGVGPRTGAACNCAGEQHAAALMAQRGASLRRSAGHGMQLHKGHIAGPR